MKPNLWFFIQPEKELYPKLHINNFKIERVDSYNFLGLQLNHNSEWDKHVNYVSLKISKISSILYMLKSEFPPCIIKSIYNTLVLAHLTNCMLSWRS